MSGGEQLDVRADLAIGADLDGCDVKGREIEVDERAFTDADIASVIDSQGWANIDPGSQFADQVFQDAAGARRILKVGPLVFVGSGQRLLR